MASNNRFRIGELWRYHLSGAPRVTAGQYSEIKESQQYLFGKSHDGFGFLSLVVDDIDTYGVDDFRPTISNGESWQHIVTHHLDPYFNFTLNSEATPDNLLAVQLRAAGCEGDCQYATANTPESFVRLTMIALEIQFPGGLGADLGDQDYRNLITARGQIFYFNYRKLNDVHDKAVGEGLNWLLTLQTGAALLMSITALFGLVDAPGWLKGEAIAASHTFADALLRPFTAFLLIAIALAVYKRIKLAHLFEKAHARFEQVTEAASTAIFHCAQSRQDRLVHGADGILAELSLSRGSYGPGRQKRWADESGRWMELLLWFQGRIGGNHNYFFCSAILHQMIEPTLKAKAQFDAAWRTLVFCGVFGFVGLIGLAASIAGGIEARGVRWEDLIYLGLTALLTTLAFWMIHRRVAYIEPETIFHISHSKGFAGLKGPADAKIPAKLARLMRQDRARQDYEQHVHLWRDDGDRYESIASDAGDDEI